MTAWPNFAGRSSNRSGVGSPGSIIGDAEVYAFPRQVQHAGRGGVIESGAGWVPDFLGRLDYASKSFKRTDPHLKDVDMLPSEYIKRAVKSPFRARMSAR